jgi:hypothetical protein
MEHRKENDTDIYRLVGRDELVAASFATIALQFTFDERFSKEEKERALSTGLIANSIAADRNLPSEKMELDLTADEFRLIRGGSQFLLNDIHVNVKKYRDGSTPGTLEAAHTICEFNAPLCRKK